MNIENLITTNAKEADKLAQDWNSFANQHPGVSHFVFKQEFVAWARTHGNVDTSIWIGKEIQDAYFFKRQEHEEKQMEQTGHVDSHDVPDALAALGFLGSVFSRERIKILERDPLFKKILDEKYDAWVKDHPGKDETSKEWLDYRYGSLENPQAPTLFSQTEEEFKTKHESLWKKYDEERKKVYDDPSQDPTLSWHEDEITLHAQARHELLKITDPTAAIEHIQKQIETTHWEQFVEKHPEKAAAYATKHDSIKEAIVRVGEKKRLHQEQLKIAAEKQAIHDQLISYQQTTGKDIHYVEDKTHKTPDISVEEASRRLGAITPPPQTLPILQRPILPSDGLVDTQGRQLRSTRPQPQFFSSIPRMSSPVNSGSAPQSSPTPQPPSPEGRGAGNSLLNKIGGFGNPANLIKNAAMRYLAGYIILIVVIIGFSFGIIMGQDATTGEATPIETGGVASTANGLDYTISFRDSSIMPVDLDKIKEAIKKDFPLAQLQYWDKIIQQSITNKWNPAFVLALWIEETGASQYTIKENGGGGGGPPNSLGHLGCAPSENQTLDESLRCLFGPQNIFSSLTNDQFDKFMCQYGGLAPRTPPCVFDSPTFPSRIKKYYSLLVPSGSGEIKLVALNTIGWPTTGRLTQGPKGKASHLRMFKESGEKNQSVDIGGSFGDPVYATFNGNVLFSCSNGSACPGGYGSTIIIGVSGQPSASILYGHLDEVIITQGDVTLGTKLGKMGSTGNSNGPHLHWEFRNISLAPPNIPDQISPEDCNDPCKPSTVRYSSVVTPPSSPPSPPTEPKPSYWFLLHRKSNTEILYFGIPGDTTKSESRKEYKVKTGKPGERPTPLPQLAIGRDYWLISGKKDTAGDPSTGPKALLLDIPYENASFGPEPYTECGGKQCNWVTSGWFGLHGVAGNNDRINNSDSWSSGCIRHYDEDIRSLYDLIGPLVDASKEIRYYIQDN